MTDGAADWLRNHADRLFWAMVALGALLRVQGLGWDDWMQFHPDERNLVTGAVQLAFPDAMIPEFHAYNGLALALPKLLAWLIYGPEPDGAAITWAARVISAVAGALAVWVGGVTARRLAGPVAGALGAALLALSAPLIQWAHFGTTESALILSVLLIWLLAVAFVDGDLGLWPAAMLIGVVLGFSLGFKTSAAAFAVIPLVAAAICRRVHGVRLIGAGAAAAGLAALIFVLSTPSVVLATGDYLATMDFEAGVVSGRNDVFWTWQFTGARDGVFEIGQLWGLLEGGGLALAMVGVAVAARGRIAAALPALVFLLIYSGLVFGWHAKFVRYLAPVVPVLLVFAAIGATRLLEAGKSRTLAAATLAALAVFAASGVGLALSYQAPDPRLAAAQSLRSQLSPGEVVLLEPVEVGPGDFAPNETRILPLIDPTGPEKTAALADALAAGDWIVIYSRRHHLALPRLPGRFPSACAYYAALFDARLGFERLWTFQRKRFLGGLFDPGTAAEETRVVFDRPEVMVFAKRERRSPDEIRTLLDAADPACSGRRAEQ